MDLRILVVDSSACNLEVLSAQVHSAGWLSIPSASVEHAVDAFGQEGAGLILLGPNLDQVAADVAVAMLRQASTKHPCPIIVLLGRAEYSVMSQRALAAGADLVIPASVEAPVLDACIRSLLRNKSLTDDLRQRARELDSLRREHRLLIDALLHDLKNPLAVVLANVGWAMDYLAPSDGEVFEALRDAQEGVHRIQGTLDDLSMVLKLEKSETPLRRDSIRVSELVRGVVSSRAPEAQARNVALTANIDEQLEFTGDANVLRRVVDSLLESSIRYAPSSGRVELSARSHSGLEIAVTNMGVVLPTSEHRIRVPARTETGQVPADDAEADEDTVGVRSSSLALRLYFCRKAVEAFHGRLELVESPEASRSLVVRLPDVGT